jgi:N-acetyl-anhydromuramyl-L-alanine amidase AmpD
MNRRKFIVTSSLLLGSVVFGGPYWKNRWKYIVIHHSAGSYGDLPFFKKVHRQRQAKDPIDAIPYHYIIGNGNGLAMGEVASDWRQSYDIWGAHVSVNNLDYNFRGIGICLVGNFENKEVPAIQYQSLLRLTKSLMSKYEILHSNVVGHRMIKGESTKCPGKHFPMKAFIADIA